MEHKSKTIIAAEKYAGELRTECATIPILVSEYRKLLLAQTELRLIRGLWESDRNALWPLRETLEVLYPAPPVAPPPIPDDTHPPHGEHAHE